MIPRHERMFILYQMKVQRIELRGKKEKRRSKPNNLSKLLEPSLLFRNLKDLNHLDNEQTTFIRQN